MEDTFTAEFPVVDIFDMLPPGDYLIPLDYKVTYYDPSDESGTSTRLESYQWDEIGCEDYMDMMWFRSDPRPTDLRKPHFMLRVMDDEDGADMSLECLQTLDSGAKRSLLQFRIFNDEFYPLKDCQIQIRSSNPDTVWSSISAGDPSLLAEGDNLDLQGSDFNTRSFIDLFGYVDVSSQAPTGQFDIKLTMKGTDERGRPLSINRTGTVDIKARPGELIIASISTGKVEPGKEFELTVRIMNSGDVTIDNYEVMLSCSDNMICVQSPVENGSSLEPGQTRTVKFPCLASDCMDYEMMSELSLLTKTNDHEGNIKEYRDDDGLPVNVIAAREPEELSSESAVRQVGMYFLIAVLVGTTIFAIALIVSVLIFSMIRRKERKGDESAVSGKKEIKPTTETKALKQPEKKEQLTPQQQTNQQVPPPQGAQYPYQDKQPMLQPAQQQAEYQPAPPAAQGDDLSGIFSGRNDSSVDDLFS
jgi:hypothetical protein